MQTTPKRWKMLASAAGVAICVLFTGCSTFRRTSTELHVRSLVSANAVVPKMTVMAYIPTDRNTVDIYLSDIPAARLSDPADSLEGVTGNIIHLHIFLMPDAGSTPIDDSACNLTVRHAILTGISRSEAGAGGVAVGNTVGIYGGGGFCLPDSKPGDAKFAGSLREATMRLVRVSPGFADRLGASSLSGAFSAPRNDELAGAISQRLETISRSLRDVAK